MTKNVAFDIPDHVIAREVGDETVILDLAGGTYFGLDPIGARMFRMLGEGQSFSAICEALLEDYEVTRETLEADLAALADELVEKNLLARRG